METKAVEQFTEQQKKALAHIAEACRKLIKCNVTASRFVVLYAISKRYLTMADIAKVSHTTPGNASVMIERMERDGFVERNNRKDDRRGVIVSLTRAGKKKLRDVVNA